MRRLVVSSWFTFGLMALTGVARAAEEPNPATPPAQTSAPPTPPPAVAPPAVAPPATVAPPVQAPPGNAAVDAADLARFRAYVSHQAAASHGYALVSGLVELGVGGIMIPAGAVLYSKDASVGPGLVLGLGIGSAASGLFGLLEGFSRTPYHAAEQAAAHEKALGHDDATALAAGEHEWQEGVATEKLERRVGGGIFLGLGLTALGLGTAFAAADLTTRTFDRREQSGLASAFLVGGAVATAAGLSAVLVPSTAESAWEGYQAGKRAPAAGIRVLGVSASPLPGGGGSAGIVGAF